MRTRFIMLFLVAVPLPAVALERIHVKFRRVCDVPLVQFQTSWGKAWFLVDSGATHTSVVEGGPAPDNTPATHELSVKVGKTWVTVLPARAVGRHHTTFMAIYEKSGVKPIGILGEDFIQQFDQVTIDNIDGVLTLTWQPRVIGDRNALLIEPFGASREDVRAVLPPQRR